MRKVIIGIMLCIGVLAIKSCQKDEQANLRVNHYMNSCVGIEPRLCFLQQENNADSEKWEYGYEEIIGFEYQWGYVYNLKVKVTDIPNPPVGSAEQEVRLVEVVSKEKVSSDVTFEITLRDEHMGSYFIGSPEQGFELLIGITMQFDEPELMDSFMDHVYSEGTITGVFKHKDNSTIQLVGFKE